MSPIYRTAEIRRIELVYAAANPGVSLMARAGLAAAEHARKMLGDGYRVVVACGPGNNGGDGFVVARHLRDWGYRVTTVFRGDVSKLPADAAGAYGELVAEGEKPLAQLPNLSGADLIIDALFGIGLARAISGEYGEWITRINDAKVNILALDIPSGLDSDTGRVRGVAVKATETVTFIGLKAGLVTGDGKDHCGIITIATLGVAEAGVWASGALLDRTTVAAYLPRRLANSHKGSFGSTGILGGAEGMQGAIALAGSAALKLGAGRVYLGTLARNSMGYDPTQPELMWRTADELLALGHLSVLAVGPGLGQAAAARVLLARAMETRLPLLLDADALNLVASHEPLQAALAARQAPSLLTPHPAEAARLLDCDTATVQGDRVSAALELAQHFHAHVVLKGAGSICVTPEARWFVNPTGNPGMATAGMGDTLSGMVAALLAQGLDAERALLLGVYLHGAAGDELVAGGTGPVGLTASEIPNTARGLLNAWKTEAGPRPDIKR